MGWFARSRDSHRLGLGEQARPLSERGAPSSSSLSQRNDLAPPSSGVPANSGTFPTQRRAKPLILFADDSAIATLKMLELLKAGGYEVATTSNGVNAIRLAKELQPNLILLDVEMPEMSGTEACAALKREPRTSSIPVVLMTAHDDPRHLRDGFRSGCDGYIPKGTSDEEVLRKLSLKLLFGSSLQSSNGTSR